MASSLGKRKEREETAASSQDHGSTLFVSNLPYTATSTDLQTLFSDIAPVRSAFVVLEQGTGVSKGVGYVSFAIKEDAESAFESKDALVLDGRKLRLQWADTKPKDGEVVKREPKARPPPRPSHPRPAHDPNAIRTLMISGLPTNIDSGTLWKKIRKYNGAESVEWPAKAEGGEEDPSKATVLFKNSASAQEAVNRLHAHVYKGALLSVTLKKRLDSLSKPAKPGKTPKATPSDPTADPSPSSVPTEQLKTVTAPTRASRLIVRNLPFQITEQDLRALFLPYGPIHSIHIPTGEGNKAKGFAFVWMLSKKDAEQALEGCNGKAVRAGMAQGLVGDKQKRKKARREERKRLLLAKAEATKAEDGDEVAEGEGEEDEEKLLAAEERIIAVDWALSKEKWQEEQAKMDVDEPEAEAENADGSSSGSGSDSDEEDEDENLGVHEDDSDSDSTPSDEDDEDAMEVIADEEKVKPQLPPPETGTTLFVRNVPFAATEDELRTL
ncbi:hypothetical protein HWV62_21940 [Athelia sp. TMB]|nr:hypothetical protein HWV62_21940 [Athelia sp. TMB]